MLFKDVQSVGVYVSQPDYTSVETKLTFDHFRVNATVGPAPAELAAQSQNVPQDVNSDGTVSAMDALMLINAIGQTASAEGELLSRSSESTSPTRDVNGDGKNYLPLTH